MALADTAVRNWLEAQNALLLQQGFSERHLSYCKVVPIEEIVPAGGAGVAIDAKGCVVGIKLPFELSSPELFELLVRCEKLERLVVASREPYSLGDGFGLLRHLHFVWLSGVESFGPSLLETGLPLRLVDTRGASDSLARSHSEKFGYDVFSATREFAAIESALRASLVVNEAATGEDERPRQFLGPESVRRPILTAADAARLHDAVRGIWIDTGSAVELVDPPAEIILQGPAAVQSFFRARRRSASVSSEVKLLLVGHGGAGKTSLVRRLNEEGFDPHEPQTHGIRIRHHRLDLGGGEETRLNIWDFGGQEVMHATHQFFLSKRSVYIVVLDGRRDEDPEYWLQHATAFGGESPILVVLNKIDDNASFDVNRRFLREKYPTIVGFFRVSCRAEIGLKRLSEALASAVASSPMARTEWPSSWYDVKASLESCPDPFVSIQRFTEICEESGVSEPATRDVLVRYLHDLGVALHFDDLQLLDTHVLDPLWVTSAVYAIINSEVVAAQRGRLRLNQVARVLSTIPGSREVYPPEKHRYVLELMVKFELCYRLSTDVVLVPDLLGVQEPVLDEVPAGALRMVVSYSFLPRSVLPRFIVATHRDIYRGRCWRTGVCLHEDEMKAFAVVRADYKARSIDIAVWGERKRDYFMTLRKHLRDIGGSFGRALDAEERVPLPDAPGVLIDYAELVGHESAGLEDIFVGRVRRSYKVKDLLSGGVGAPEREPAGFSHEMVAGSGAAPAQDFPSEAPPDGVPVPSSASIGGAVWERAVVVGFAVAVTILVGYLIVEGRSVSDPNMVAILRTGVSIAAAVFGAALPGFLQVEFGGKNYMVRAFGALAMFVLTYLTTPTVLQSSPADSSATVSGDVGP